MRSRWLVFFPVAILSLFPTASVEAANSQYYSAPQNLTATSFDDGSVALTWDMPFVVTHEIALYVITFYDMDTGVESGGWGIWVYGDKYSATLGHWMFDGSNPVTTGYGAVRFKVNAGSNACIGLPDDVSCQYGDMASVDVMVLDPSTATTTTTTTTVVSVTTTTDSPVSTTTVSKQIPIETTTTVPETTTTWASTTSSTTSTTTTTTTSTVPETTVPATNPTTTTVQETTTSTTVQETTTSTTTTTSIPETTTTGLLTTTSTTKPKPSSTTSLAPTPIAVLPTTSIAGTPMPSTTFSRVLEAPSTSFFSPETPKSTIPPQEAFAIAVSAQALSVIEPAVAEQVFESLDVAHLDDTEKTELIVSVQSAPKEVRQAFESKVNMFTKGFDEYVPVDSRIPVGERRTLIAIGVGVSIVAVSPTRVKRR